MDPKFDPKNEIEPAAGYLDLNKPLKQMTDEEAMVAFAEWPCGVSLPPAEKGQDVHKPDSNARPSLDTDALEFGPTGYPTGLYDLEEP